jgi:hypothetical protein
LYKECEKWFAWFKTGVWKLREMRKGFDIGRYPLYSEDEDVVHIILKCSETMKWREQILSRKWFVVNEEIAYKKITNCTNAV